MDRYERQVEKPTATSPLHQSTLALALDMWLLELGMHISRYISSPSRVQPVPWFKTSSTRKGWGIPVDIESGYPIFHLQPRCKRGIYASGIGTTLVGSKFSQSSGRLRGLGLAYSPNKGRRFDFFYQWCNDGATQISYLSDLSRNYVKNGWKWSQANFWCRNVTTWDYLPWISRL